MNCFPSPRSCSFKHRNSILIKISQPASSLKQHYNERISKRKELSMGWTTKCIDPSGPLLFLVGKELYTPGVLLHRIFSVSRCITSVSFRWFIYYISEAYRQYLLPVRVILPFFDLWIELKASCLPVLDVVSQWISGISFVIWFVLWCHLSLLLS